MLRGALPIVLILLGVVTVGQALLSAGRERSRDHFSLAADLLMGTAFLAAATLGLVGTSLRVMAIPALIGVGLRLMAVPLSRLLERRRQVESAVQVSGTWTAEWEFIPDPEPAPRNGPTPPDEPPQA